MKRFATMALAAATLIAPLATPISASAQDWRRHDRYDRRDRDRDHDRGRYERWERGRHNGYTYRGRWYYGPPPRAYFGYYTPGYRAWRRGDVLPSYYRSHYYGVDWRAYRLRPPPRGYRWVRDDRGEFLLVGIATGVILSAILNNY